MRATLCSRSHHPFTSPTPSPQRSTARYHSYGGTRSKLFQVCQAEAGIGISVIANLSCPMFTAVPFVRNVMKVVTWI